jgi:cell division protein FtsB
MDKNVKFIGGLSRKTKINIFVAVFLIFILISVFTSINQISRIIRNREIITELEHQLNWERQKNIGLLAEEKSLYTEEAIELEARKQFNMTKGEETNYFVEIDETSGGTSSENIEASDYGPGFSESVYQKGELWENLRVFYNSEVKQD